MIRRTAAGGGQFYRGCSESLLRQLMPTRKPSADGEKEKWNGEEIGTIQQVLEREAAHSHSSCLRGGSLVRPLAKLRVRLPQATAFRLDCKRQDGASTGFSAGLGLALQHPIRQKLLFYQPAVKSFWHKHIK